MHAPADKLYLSTSLKFELCQLRFLLQCFYNLNLWCLVEIILVCLSFVICIALTMITVDLLFICECSREAQLEMVLEFMIVLWTNYLQRYGNSFNLSLKVFFDHYILFVLFVGAFLSNILFVAEINCITDRWCGVIE